jgi:hypothetical protein
MKLGIYLTIGRGGIGGFVRCVSPFGSARAIANAGGACCEFPCEGRFKSLPNVQTPPEHEMNRSFSFDRCAQPQ